MDEKLRAQESLRLLSNETFIDVFQTLKDHTIAQWAECPARDTEAREWLWMFYQNTVRFENVLKGYLASGKIEDFNQKQGIIGKVSSILNRGKPK